MTGARIRHLRRLFGLTETQARLIIALQYGAAHD
jgi:hypothetical protein